MIEELAHDSMAIVRQAIVNNPQTTNNILNKLTSDRSELVRAAIALRKDISEAIAVALANDSSVYVRQRLVCNPNIPVKILELLSKDIDLISKDGNSSVQIEMIRNVELSPQLFENLASSSSAKVRKEVAKHPQAPLSVLDRLKTDEDKYVRVEVANNPHISPEVMEYLAKDSINEKPTSRAWKYCSNRVWKYHSYKRWTDYHDQVRIAIAQRKDLTEKVASILLKDPLPKVRHKLVCNPNIPAKIIELSSKEIDLISREGNSWVQIEMIKNVELSPQLFENLASSSSSKVRQEVAKHPQAPLSVLDRLKTDNIQICSGRSCQ